MKTIKIFIKRIFKNKKLYNSILFFYNNFNFKNKIHAKGLKLNFGSTRLNGLKIYCHGNNNTVVFNGFGKIINSTINIQGNNNVILIGDHILMNQVDLYMEDDNNKIIIGKQTSMCGKAHFATIEGTSIIIGDNCLFSSNLHFSTGDSHSILNDYGQRINPSQDIKIGNHVWVGTAVTCLKGVTINDDSIVGATTTLSKKYDSKNCIIAGVPGKIIKDSVSWDYKRFWSLFRKPLIFISMKLILQ